MVSLTVSVTGEAGRHLSDLKRESFTVYEAGVRQEIAHFSIVDQPASISIVFDVSASMKGKKFDQAAQALKQFVKTTHRDDNFSLVGFNDHASVLLDSVNDAEELLFKVTGILPRGNTSLHDAVAMGLRQMANGPLSRQVLIVITDGQDNHSRLSGGKLRRMAEEAGVPIYSIPIRDFLIDRSGKPLIEELSELTGGRNFTPHGEEELNTAFERIALELRHQYSIEYIPSNFTDDGKWRRLKIEVHPPAGTKRPAIRHRKGYYAVAQPNSP
jgi:VWFA-related protein